MFSSVGQDKTVMQTLNRHVSVRDFSERSIDDKLLHKLLESAKRSPTSSNLQTYTFVVIQNQETKKQLAKLAGGQKHVETCPVFVAVCADISRLETACKMHGKKLATSLETTLVATVDASLAGMSLSLAAEAEGLGTVMIGGMRNYPDKVAELLEFPKGVYVVYGLCIGWPKSRSKQKPRLSEKINIHYEKYKTTSTHELEEYDAELFKHYQQEKRPTPTAAWTGIIAKRYSETRRTSLRTTLETLGFSFD